ncbi:LuxR family transcriptional regulator [Phytoactinopolyspora alkaliphila]|uniref:LuxR family transcriptional regulator n=1 Tax=Phytoactinopolyspora alkaliphila TaxID=1783498 RepID=A0A6N9YTV6_9ACTN|nr:LuxR family transcriptional regulator [Phytoactinopolyspora alkaliphila]NED98248.1 LuxR family transcriptional regulator [Phytoactinopolyspora alkaliphila]
MNLGRTVKPAEHQPASGGAHWREICDRLGDVAPETLEAGELESLADAKFWLGRPRESITVRQLAYRRHRDAHDAARATKAAWRLFYSYFDLNETAVASGWLQRAHRHALEAPEQIESHYVSLADADWALYQNKLDDALSSARHACDAARQFDDRDLEALSLGVQGRILISRGAPAEGLDRLDEAMVVALSGELTAFATGWVHCLLLSTCQELGDVRRAAEWTGVAVPWAEDHGEESWYPGLCRLHRCEVQSLRGEWSAAEREALHAAEELAPFGEYLIADGQYLAGEIRRRRGDHEGAKEAFLRAHQLGRDPQPGLALLKLAQGEAHQAAATLRLALSAQYGGPVGRARLLSAHVEAELCAGDVEAAARSAGELHDLAEASRTPYLRGMAAAANGAVLLARGDVNGALPVLRSACDIYRSLSCPYECAASRVFLGIAARQAGDEHTARLEFDAAMAVFERLGAAPDVERVNALLNRDTSTPDGLTQRELEVLKLVAHGRSNRQIGAELFISEHTVARHVSNIFAKIDVTSRSAATSYAFRHHLA